MSQLERRWPNGTRTAVSIAYVGGLGEHVDAGRHLLRDLDVRASFFLSPNNAIEHLSKWKELALDGHEFGNAALFDCTTDGSLDNWTLSAVEQEIIETDTFLHEELSVQSNGFFYPGVQSNSAQGPYDGFVTKRFEYAIRPNEGANPFRASLHNLRCHSVLLYPHPTLESLETSRALRWQIFAFDHLYRKDHAAILVHRLVVEAIARKRQRVWIAPCGDVVRRIATMRLAG